MKKAPTIVILLVIGASFLCETWFVGLSAINVAPEGAQGSMAQTYSRALGGGKAYLEDTGSRPIDTSLYKGRLYLYFGIAPFALFLVPWALLTHTLPSDGAVLLSFLLMGYLLYGMVLRMVFLRQTGNKSLLWLAVSSFTIVVCSGTLALIGRPAIYEIETAAAYAVSGASILCLVMADAAPYRRSACLMAAVLFAGLTIGCRPSYFPAVGIIVAWAVFLGSANAPTPSARIRQALLIASPLCVVGFGLAYWNYHRFSNPLEFGLAYTGFSQRTPHLVSPSLGVFLYNAHRYLLGGFRLGQYFPFIDGVSPGPFPLPPSEEPVNQVYGCLVIFPIVGWAAYSAWADRAAKSWARHSAALLVAALMNFALLALLVVGTYRYPVDFLGILSFVAAIGLLRPIDSESAAVRRCAQACLFLLFLWSICLGFLEAVSVARTSELFEEARLRDFSLLAAPFNRVAYAVERIAGGGPRYARLELRFPSSRYGRVEPLLVCGENGLQDFVYVLYAGPGLVQLGFESIGFGGPVSALIPIDYGSRHVIGIDLGSFLPPADHPLMRRMRADDERVARNFIHVTLDGRTVIDCPAKLHPVRSRIMVGESSDDDAFGRKFTGDIVSVTWPRVQDIGLFPDWRAGEFGPLIERVFLLPMPPGTLEPLVSAGYHPSGGVVVVEHLAGRRIRLGWKGYGKESAMGEPFTWDYGSPHDVHVSFGSLYPPISSVLWDTAASEGKRRAIKRLFRCDVDGTTVWSREIETPDVSPYSVTAGVNTLLLTGVSERLSGRVVAVKRASWDGAPSQVAKLDPR